MDQRRLDAACAMIDGMLPERASLRADSSISWTGFVKLMLEARKTMPAQKWNALRDEAFRNRDSDEVLSRIVKQVHAHMDVKK